MLAEQDVTSKKAYVKEHEHIKTRGWAYYAFNVTDEDYQVVVNVAEEEDSACKLQSSAMPHIFGIIHSAVVSHKPCLDMRHALPESSSLCYPLLYTVNSLYQSHVSMFKIKRLLHFLTRRPMSV